MEAHTTRDSNEILRYVIASVDPNGTFFFYRPGKNLHYEKAEFYRPLLGYKINIRLRAWKFFRTGVLKEGEYGIYFCYSERKNKTTGVFMDYQRKVDLPDVVEEIEWYQ